MTAPVRDDREDDGQHLEETATQYALRRLQAREKADQDRIAALQGHDTRGGMPNKRCPTHNILAEPVAVVSPHSGYYCMPCDAILLRPHHPA